MATTISPFSRLPDELLREILRHLPYYTLQITIPAVSTRLRRITINDKSKYGAVDRILFREHINTNDPSSSVIQEDKLLLHPALPQLMYCTSDTSIDDVYFLYDMKKPCECGVIRKKRDPPDSVIQVPAVLFQHGRCECQFKRIPLQNTPVASQNLTSPPISVVHVHFCRIRYPRIPPRLKGTGNSGAITMNDLLEAVVHGARGRFSTMANYQTVHYHLEKLVIFGWMVIMRFMLMSGLKSWSCNNISP